MDMRNQGYDFTDCIKKTSDCSHYLPGRDSYLSYWGREIDLYMKSYEAPVSHIDFPHLLFSLSFLSSTLPSPKNTKLSHPTLSLDMMIMS